MKKKIAAWILFLLPSPIANYMVRLLGYRIYGRVGFSLLFCDQCDIARGAVVQSGCFIKIPQLQMEQGAKIKKGTAIKGGFSLAMRSCSILNSFSKVTNSEKLQYRPIKLEIGKMSVLGVSSRIDMTGNVTIGDYTVFAGIGTEIWTHSYYHSKKVPTRFRIDGDVWVGNNVYLGSRCIVTGGVHIADNISIGAGAVISKNLDKPGLYVNQPLRFLEFDPDDKIRQYEMVPDTPIDHVFHKNHKI